MYHLMDIFYQFKMMFITFNCFYIKKNNKEFIKPTKVKKKVGKGKVCIRAKRPIRLELIPVSVA